MKYITPAQHNQMRPDVHPSQRQHHVTPVSSPLYVVTAITNPNRYYSRYKLYQAFEKMCEDAGAILYTVELATRDRHFEVTDPNNPRHIQLRSPDVLWHKENLLNIGISRLPEDWEYVAWIDSDLQFARPDWAVETVHQLQIYRVVQMWTTAVDLDHEFNPTGQSTSLFQTYQKNHRLLRPLIDKEDLSAAINQNPTHVLNELASTLGDPYYGSSGPLPNHLLHPGYAWAARRSALSDLGGLGDIGILGAGDRHMAYALLGAVEQSLGECHIQSYKEYWLEWQNRAERHIQRKVGVVPGTVLHYWHGAKAHRRYYDRWRILKDFDYRFDLKRDPQGVFQLTDRNWRLRDDILGYFSVRNEDDISL